MVTHKMLEILMGVARFPSQYRRIRKDVMLADYKSHMTTPAAMEALDLLLFEINEDAASERGLACFNWITETVRIDVEQSCHRT